MTSATLPGFLNKKEIEANYGRSYRSLTRDITKAVRTGDASVLQHLKLVTEDEAVREGSEVTLELIQELSNNGLRPMWLAEESWVAEWCANRSAVRQQDDARIVTEPEREPVIPTKSFDSPAVVQLLQQRITDLAKQNDTLHDQLKIKDDQIRAANQQAEQSQELMRDLHVLLKNVQDGLLGEGRRLIAAPSKPQQPTTVAIHPKEFATSRPIVPRTEAEPADKTAPKTRQSRAPRRANGTPSMPQTKARQTKRKSSKPFNQQAAQQSNDRLHRWFPTFFRANRRPKK